MSQNKLVVVRRLAVRTTIVLLAVALVAIVAFPQVVAMGVRMVIDIAPPVTPPPPVFAVPPGAMPAGVVGLQEWARENAELSIKEANCMARPIAVAGGHS